MAIQTSGTIAISDIVSEFGGSAPHALTEYYRNGSLVPSNSSNTGIPTSGTISITDFYGADSLVLAQLIYNGSASNVETSGSFGGTVHRVTVAGNRVVKSFAIASNAGTTSGNMQIRLTGENMRGGANATISRTGGITETGPTSFANPPTAGGGGFGVTAATSALTVPNNRFLVGVAWANPYNFNIMDGGNVRFSNNIQAYTRHSAYANCTWSGGVSTTGVIYSEPGGPHSGNGTNPASSGFQTGANLGSTSICVGFQMGNGGYGEWTDGGYTSVFQMGLRSTTTGIG